METENATSLIHKVLFLCRKLLVGSGIFLRYIINVYIFCQSFASFLKRVLKQTLKKSRHLLQKEFHMQESNQEISEVISFVKICGKSTD